MQGTLYVIFKEFETSKMPFFKLPFGNLKKKKGVFWDNFLHLNVHFPKGHDDKVHTEVATELLSVSLESSMASLKLKLDELERCKIPLVKVYVFCI